MNSRARMQAALAGRPVDRAPVAPCYLDLYLDAVIRRRYRAAYAAKLAGRTCCRIDHAEDVRFRAQAVRLAYQVLAEPPDWMHAPYGESAAWAERGEIHLEDGQFFYVDRESGARQDLDRPETFLLPASVAFIDPNDAQADNWDPLADVKSEADIDALIPVAPAEQLEAAGVFDVARLLAQELGDRVYLRCETGTPYWYAYTVLGFSGMMVMLRQRPDLFCHVMERKHRQRIEVCRGFARAGVDAVWVEEALSSADLISPATYERFAFPTTRAYLEGLNRLGLTTILYYCGDVVPRLPWLRHLGMAALAVEESKKGFKVEIERVIEGLDSACAAFGNVDSIEVVERGQPGILEAEVRRQVLAGRKARGFVLCQGSPFPLDVTPARVDEFILAARATAS